MKDMLEHRISVSKPQMRKLMSGGAITLKPSNFDPSSRHMIMVMPNTSRRIGTAMKKQKGIRIALKPDEDIMEETMEGGKISLKKTFAPVASAAKSAAKKVKKGFEEEVVDSGLGKEIAKGLIRTSTGVLLPAAGTALSMLAGDPTGMSGGIPAQIAGQELQQYAERKGFGLYKTLSKVGIKKKDAQKVLKDVGKNVVRQGAAAAGMALTAYTGNPAVGSAFERVAVSAGDKAIESKKAKDVIKNAGRAVKKEAKMIGVEMVDDYVDKNLSGVEKEVAQKALAGKYPSAKDLIYDYSNSKVEEISSGLRRGEGFLRKSDGRVRVTRLGLKTGKGLGKRMKSAVMSADDLRVGGSITGMPTAGFDKRRVTAPSMPSGVIQLGSPYARIESAQMSPFIAASPMLSTKPIRGGSFRPAGKLGGSFIAA